MSASLDQPSANAASPLRPLDQIFALRGDANREREMQATWRSFCRDRLDAVREVLASDRSSPEIAYQLGELLHNHFRTRGVTLTSHELRRLVAELLALPKPAGEGTATPTTATREPASPAPTPPVVSFERELPKMPWPGDSPGAPTTPRISDTALEPPPSPIVSVKTRDAAPFERLFARAMDLAKSRSVPAAREPARSASNPPVPEPPVAAAPPPPVTPEPPDSAARAPEPGASEPPAIGPVFEKTYDLGPLAGLWSDPGVRAIFVNGPQTLFVERAGALHTVDVHFDDEAQLRALASRLAGQPKTTLAAFALPEGATGFAIFPPASPAGPVLALRRADAGEATLDGLVASGLVERPVIELLRLGARARLNMLVTGPAGSGKTALLAALVRDLEPAQRVVTVAADRTFRWPMASKVELVASKNVPFAALVDAAAQLQPRLLVLDGVRLVDVAALSERLLRGAPGILASVGSEAMSAALGRSAELIVRLDRAEGRSRVVAIEDAAGLQLFSDRIPAFAAILQARGFGEAWDKLSAANARVAG